MMDVRTASCALALFLGLASTVDVDAGQLNILGQAGGWDGVLSRPAITTVSDVSGFTTDMASARVATAINNSFNTWESAEGATTLQFRHRRDLGGNYDLFDGPSDSGGPPWFDGSSATLDADANFRYADLVIGGFLPESYFLGLDPVNGANILAATWVAPLVSNPSGKVLWKSEVFFNDSYNWTDDAEAANADFLTGLPNRIIDLETVALHEIGHALGLDHEDAVGSVMASLYSGVARDLFLDDIDTIVSLYSRSFGRPAAFGLADNETVSLAGVTYLGVNLVAPVPEPTTLILFTIGGLGLLIRRRRA